MKDPGQGTCNRNLEASFLRTGKHKCPQNLEPYEQMLNREAPPASSVHKYPQGVN
jgi:hypothetical protein